MKGVKNSMTDKMNYRIESPIPAPCWQAEHKARQYRLIIAIDSDYISEACAEMLDSFDNFLRYTWLNACVVCLYSSN